MIDMQPKARCVVCGKVRPGVARQLGVCAQCLRQRYQEASAHLEAVHAGTRAEFDLPLKAPHSEGGVQCRLCANECTLAEGERGFCGLRLARDGRLVHLAGTARNGLLHFYRDSLPTNCVAAWVCQGSKQRGKQNLAVFYASCTANCLFCQNWSYRQADPQRDKLTSAKELAAQANRQTYCVCFFGGDPSSQMPHALLSAARLARRGVRVCWETNGMLNPKSMQAARALSLESGGCLKFDLKAYDDGLHRALTGVSNQRTLRNFERCAQGFEVDRETPLVIASTLLVPGYVDAEQVQRLAEFIAAINPYIPYALLAFAPNFYMSDLGCTTLEQAQDAEQAARQAGLRRVRVGNRHLLDMGFDF
jgi:pyruvate formate lyase activating enzyme